MTDKDQKVFMAKLAEQAERYEEMAEFMKEVAQMDDGELKVEDRNLLSVAYKNVIGARRAAWRIISNLESRSDKNKDLITKYKEKVEEELNNICEDIIKLLDEHLIKNSSTAESQVFFFKMKGDYLRYKAEIAAGENKSSDCDKAEDAYKSAALKANEELTKTNPIRLGLYLNFSVFHYELRNNSEKACELAKEAFDSAISELDTLSDDKYKDSTLIMQLLRDNLTLWTADNEDDGTKAVDLDDEDAKK
mmetsp:Transcript_18491/g.31404  ORF Transcript_18491/g.31404 Transcript_18491/m.31404 type:complete len:249 (-) Transcript_18491:866-1612(-)